jgi:hypothetical protein
MGLVLLVNHFNLEVMQRAVLHLCRQVAEWVLELLFQVLRVAPAILRAGCRHLQVLLGEALLDMLSRCNGVIITRSAQAEE